MNEDGSFNSPTGGASSIAESLTQFERGYRDAKAGNAYDPPRNYRTPDARLNYENYRKGFDAAREESAQPALAEPFATLNSGAKITERPEGDGARSFAVWAPDGALVGRRFFTNARGTRVNAMRTALALLADSEARRLSAD